MRKRDYRSVGLENEDRKIQGNKKARSGVVIVEDDDRHPDFQLVSKFLESANEDILLEIFLRLPNCRYATVFASVCRRWQSVICHPQFIPRFIRLHQETYTIMFRITGLPGYASPSRDNNFYQPFLTMSSPGEPLLKKPSSSSSSSPSPSVSYHTYLDFMPCFTVIRASFDDLLLVSSRACMCRDYYICNPVTKKYFRLPDFPTKEGVIGFALICTPNEQQQQQLGFAQCNYHYKVVLIHVPILLTEVDEPDVRFSATIFCSKLGCWRRTPFFSYPRPTLKDLDFFPDIVRCNNGILFWMEGRRDLERIVALDVLNLRCGVIYFPDDFGSGCRKTYVKAQLGVVGGEQLRLLKLFRTNDDKEECFVIKVWELKDYNREFASASWVLVHEINLNSPNAQEVVSIAFHPKKGNVLFVIWGKCVFEYQISQDLYMYQKVDDFQEPIVTYPDVRIRCTTLMHPVWPTPAPSHPSSK